MRIATWNVNSLRVRLDRVSSWIVANQPDVLCLQETKMADAAFPSSAFEAIGYQSVHHGDGRWNGVAIVSRVGIDEVDISMGGPADAAGCRLVAATCGGVRVHSIYVPNGRSVDSEHFAEKLAWLAALRSLLDATCRPSEPVAVCGDFNVAPDDRDVWDPAAMVGSTHVTQAEREALAGLEQWGLHDAFRIHHADPGLFSWWDYRGGSFHRGQGMRIDLVLLSHSLAKRCSAAWIDREQRKGPQPSDHAPVVADIDGDAVGGGGDLPGNS